MAYSTETTAATNEEATVDTTAESTVVKEDNTVAETVQEEVYQLEYLVDNCKALGYKKEVVAGAFFNCEKTQMSKSEFEETIKNFLGKKVK